MTSPPDPFSGGGSCRGWFHGFCMLQLPCVVAVGVRRSAWCSPCRGNPRRGAGSHPAGRTASGTGGCDTRPTGARRVSVGSEQARTGEPILSPEARAAMPILHVPSSSNPSLPKTTNRRPRDGSGGLAQRGVADRYLQGVPVPVLVPEIARAIGVEGPRSGRWKRTRGFAAEQWGPWDVGRISRMNWPKLPRSAALHLRTCYVMHWQIQSRRPAVTSRLWFAELSPR